jgi:hypothetical protein
MASDGRKQLQRWQELATEAVKETDPQKLIKIVKNLCSLLDAEEKPLSRSRATPTNRKRAPTSS